MNVIECYGYGKCQSQYFLFNSKDKVISDLNYVFAHDQNLILPLILQREAVILHGVDDPV